jgi:enediyne biosynthesis protein E4
MRSPRAVLLIVLAGSLVLFGGSAIIWWRNKQPHAPSPIISAQEHRRIASNVLHSVNAETVAEVLRIEAEERQAAETFWAKEMLAQQCGAVIERFWDAINAATNAMERWSVIRDFSLQEVVLGDWSRFEQVRHGIEVAESGGVSVDKPSEGETTSGARRLLSANEWRNFISMTEKAGWQLEQTEFRHNKFDLDGQGKPSRSHFYFSAHVKNGLQRAQVEGDILVDWGAMRENGEPDVVRVDASGLTIKRRSGEPPFKLVLDEEIIPQGQSRSIDPLILYDLDGDGLSEILLAGRNLLFRNRGGFKFEREALCKYPEEFISTSLVADFDGDGVADFLAHKWEGTFLFKGGKEGRFDEKPRRVWKPAQPLHKPMVMTCGDIDADGDLDLFIAQYKEPYEGGATPQPFYDANDGYPAYLLLNDGTGEFRDATADSGLAPKRNRRTYSASFADLDRDADLDLLVVSDFAGLDLYRNDGKGRFTDLIGEWIQSPTAAKAFGMAHALSDFNNDGLIDLFMTGMTSPTVERLDHLGLARNETAMERTMRREMTHGNRLYLRTERGTFEETALSETIARSGWSWGCAAFDFDNDGWTDLYVANGLESNASVKDYEPEYWLHDRFAQTKGGSATELYFKAKFSRTRSRTYSYGGYEKNRMFINLQGKRFFEAGYLFDLALTQDCRNLVSCDFDGDGRLDLAVMTLEIWPRAQQSLKMFRNVADSRRKGNWVGFHFEGGEWAGAEVRLYSDAGEKVREIVTGDSYRSAHAPTVHFGLGDVERAERVEIRRVGEALRTIQYPELNRYYHFRAEALK